METIQIGWVSRLLSQEFLRQTILFRDLTEDELLEIIMIGHIKKYDAEKIIFKEGDPGDKLYLIIEGSVRISKFQNDSEEALAVLDRKSFFGEMALFDGEPRSAHAIAHGRFTLFVISAKDLIRLFDAHQNIAYKFLWAFCITLTHRLRTSNEKFQVIVWPIAGFKRTLRPRPDMVNAPPHRPRSMLTRFAFHGVMHCPWASLA